MRAVDTNILVFAQREELPRHDRARRLLQDLCEGRAPWALAWPCVYEFVRVVTHPRLFDPPTAIRTAVDAVRTLTGSPSVMLLGEGPRHGHWFETVVAGSRVTGNHVFDAHIAALMREHGVEEILTCDTDFHRFEGLRVVDPFPDDED